MPEPLGIKQYKTGSILLLPWLNLKNGNQETLGKGLAWLHKKSSENNPSQYGWSADGFIGSTPQAKGWNKNWGDYFVKLRLIPQIKIASNWGLKLSNYKKLLLKLIEYLNNYQPLPSLVHGDLWGGNSSIDSKGRGVIYDPATYWADREVDIAMTKLFGGFTTEFYKGYESIWQLNNSYKSRIKIYNLYHILNHANIFRGSYMEQSISLMKEIELTIS